MSLAPNDGINDNTRPNCDIPTPFYSHFVRVLHEFSVDAYQPKPSKVYYMERIKFTVTPVQARCENTWNQYFGPGVIWKDIWKDISRSWNDPLLRDFDWRTIHRILPVNSRLNQCNYRMLEHCARSGARTEILQHVLVHCPKIKALWMCILSLCNRIDPSVIGLSEKTLLLGSFPRGSTKDQLCYLISVGKCSAWKERVSYQYTHNEKINCLVYFKNYVRLRLEMELSSFPMDVFLAKWAVNNVLATQKNNSVHILV